MPAPAFLLHMLILPDLQKCINSYLLKSEKHFGVICLKLFFYSLLRLLSSCKIPLTTDIRIAVKKKLRKGKFVYQEAETIFTYTMPRICLWQTRGWYIRE